MKSGPHKEKLNSEDSALLTQTCNDAQEWLSKNQSASTEELE